MIDLLLTLVRYLRNLTQDSADDDGKSGGFPEPPQTPLDDRGENPLPDWSEPLPDDPDGAGDDAGGGSGGQYGKGQYGKGKFAGSDGGDGGS